MENMKKENSCKGCGCCEKHDENESMMAKMLTGAMAVMALEALLDEADMPDASPMDLLSPSDYKKMDRYLDVHFGPFREAIDENYVALLLALSEYEKVDIGAKIKAHLIHNLTNR